MSGLSSPTSSARGPAAWLLGMMLLVAGCGGSGSGGGLSGGSTREGRLLDKPGGGLYFEDLHSGGGSSRPRLLEAFWGRLVDVHGLAPSGELLNEPVLRDFIIGENVLDVFGDYRLEINPITQVSRLVVERVPGAPDLGQGTFEDLLRRVASGLAGVVPRSEDASSTFTYMARNAALMLRFDDLLDDSPESVSELGRTVRVVSGYPPTTPFEARIVFDPNHGGEAGGVFHSTRVLIDMTVSEAEASDSPVPLSLNSVGLPRSDVQTSAANVSVRIPTRRDPGSGQFALLTNLSDSPIDTNSSRPFDANSPTRDLVRALRAGSEADVNNGFLLDFDPPRLVGTWPCTMESVEQLDQDGFRWRVELRFSTACRKLPEPGDVIVVGERFLEVDSPGIAIDSNGGVLFEAIALSSNAPQAAELLGQASFQTLFVLGSGQESGCFLRFDPPPRGYPTSEVPAGARTTLRFTEPMDPASAAPFDTFMVVRGRVGTAPGPPSFIVGSIRASSDLREFSFLPSLPYAHLGNKPFYHVIVPSTGGMTDLAGNELLESLPNTEFTIDSLSPPARNGGIVLRFETPDELDLVGALDLRGQFTYDLENSRIRPRAAITASRAVERANPIVSIMTAFPSGVQTPLSPLGSKLQAVWRYLDFGWTVADESKHNLDVIGLYWSPAAGNVISDFFEDFEIRLAHSNRIPDEDALAPITGSVRWPESGVRLSDPFVENILADPVSPQKIMNARALGYRVTPGDLGFSMSGTPIMPWPFNRAGGPLVSFTWRDSAVTALGGHESGGVPLDIESGAPLNLGQDSGSFAAAGEVPAVALPLLMEFRCYPTDTALGLNPVAIVLASNLTAAPNFRAYSTGGFNGAGQAVIKNPDLQPRPTGGYNPNSRPPGNPTLRSAENALYLGQMDYVIRVSRAHSVWIDLGSGGTRFHEVVVEPGPDVNPPGTQVVVDFRGADSFLDTTVEPFSAASIDTLGELRSGTVLFHNDDASWKGEAQGVDGSRYVQLRFSFLNNIEAGLVPFLSGFGIAYEFE